MSSASEYAVGQRWLSNTESELGLGAIVNQDFRSVEVFYPATGESRKYTKNDAPLTRLTFEVGDTIKSQDGWSMEVSDIEVSQDVVIYHGKHTETGETSRLPETMLDHHIRLNQPEQRLFSMQHDIPKWFDLRLKAFTYMSDYQRSQTIGLAGARIELIPHQLHIASQVGNRHAPRVLLADEVGLGKTIEAALIIHQQIKTARAQRVLIVVPDSLVHQWLVEMLRRVNLAFAIFDESRCEAMDESEQNPFEQEQLVLCSLDFLRDNTKRHEQALAAGWDLLVVDEAHHLVWSAEAPSADYQCIEALAQTIAGVLLLTATPDQLGHESHFARLRLLDPARFHDYDTFLKEESQYSELAEAVTPLLGDDTLDDEQIKRIRELAPYSASELTNLDDFDQRDALLHALIDRHGTGRLLFRNRRAGITGFPERHLQAHPLPLPDVYEDMLELTDDLDEALYPERQPSLVNSWTDLDPRVEWLLEFLPSVKPEKVLLICASAVTAQQLGEAIRLRTGIRHSVFHEGMSIVERDKAAHFFADDEEGAQILLCSEIGSEGRNFQFAHHLVLFDLPMTPDLLEQRIGRLDRIGQTKDIQIHVPYLEDTAQSVLLDWYHDGLGAFTQTCPTGTGVFEQVKDQLTDCLLVPQDKESRAALVSRTHEINQSLRQQLDAGRDRLLELNASGKGKVEDLLDDIIAQDANDALADFMNWLFDAIGVNQEDKGNDCFILRPGESMVNSLPGLDPEGMTVTYRRRVATTLEHVHYLSWDHPLVHNAVDVILTDTIGKASLGFIADRTLPKGAYWLEALFTLSVNAPAHLQASRFLPAIPIKLCIDAQGEESDTTFEKTRRANKKIAQQLIGALKTPVNNQIDKARELASAQAETLLTQARDTMKSSLGAETERLRELQQDNPAIRDSEIAFIDDQIAALDAAFDDAEVQLDALRIVVNNP